MIWLETLFTPSMQSFLSSRFETNKEFLLFLEEPSSHKSVHEPLILVELFLIWSHHFKCVYINPLNVILGDPFCIVMMWFNGPQRFIMSLSLSILSITRPCLRSTDASKIDFVGGDGLTAVDNDGTVNIYTTGALPSNLAHLTSLLCTEMFPNCL